MSETFLEPTWTTAENRDTANSVFNEYIVSPASICALLVRFLQLHFITTATIHDPALYPLLWTNTNATKILIAAGSTSNVNNASKKPGIFIRSSEFKTEEPYMNPDVVQVTRDSQILNPMYYKLFTGNIEVRCESTTSSEVERLGEEVFKTLLPIVDILKQDMKLKKLSLSGASASQKQENGVFGCILLLSWLQDVFYTIPEETPW